MTCREGPGDSRKVSMCIFVYMYRFVERDLIYTLNAHVCEHEWIHCIEIWISTRSTRCVCVRLVLIVCVYVLRCFICCIVVGLYIRTHIHKCVPTCIHTVIQTYRHTDTQTCRRARMHACKHTLRT